jgi:hypothetical protein
MKRLGRVAGHLSLWRDPSNPLDNRAYTGGLQRGIGQVRDGTSKT